MGREESMEFRWLLGLFASSFFTSLQWLQPCSAVVWPLFLSISVCSQLKFKHSFRQKVTESQQSELLTTRHTYLGTCCSITSCYSALQSPQ
ncbi:hypothetical protein M440DRAFT_181362 [Trichoderma longibrachiatum ATCC 18648]|uniref:Uncharacterized protein n=1 Tax=Trichoderma longibrachiatum ATCC 18648 TaxID=983965 RepID=A0A2T4CF08_TRILO|nr:hypothetical protein M440DRAFT_181362 [Trichoderma longibrachiatum ATCC 18648]